MGEVYSHLAKPQGKNGRLSCWLIAASVIVLQLMHQTPLCAQNQIRTLGLLHNDGQVPPGFVLLAPLYSQRVHLLSTCGNVVHSWTTDARPQHHTELLPNGDLIRVIEHPADVNANTGGGAIERRDWDGNVVWKYVYPDANVTFHHGFTMLPNGNILVIAHERISRDEFLANGGDPQRAIDFLIPDMILEIKQTGPTSGDVVWKWRTWDHTIQHLTPTLPNYGAPSQYPHRVNVNYPTTGAGSAEADWTHFNTVAYNAELDQIVISVLHFNEMWVVDHSTTTEEARGSRGGRYGKGGDLLFRFGNPEAYMRGTTSDRIFFGQHDCHWVPNELPHGRSIVTFNNGRMRPNGDFSSIDKVIPSMDENGLYVINADDPFKVELMDRIYVADPPSDFFSPFVSGVQILSDGGMFICEGMNGRLFEVDATGKVRWEYINPVNGPTPLSQGEKPHNNIVFQAVKYAPDFPAFVGRKLSGTTPLELNPIPYDCQESPIPSSAPRDEPSEREQVKVLQTADGVTIQVGQDIRDAHVVDVHGQTVIASSSSPSCIYLNGAVLSSGVYFVVVPGVGVWKVILP